MVNYKFQRTRSMAPLRKSKTLPSQSMSIQELVRRYVKGIPADVVQREPVYVDQSEHDLEKLARQDFAEKAETAEALRQKSQAIVSDAYESHERKKRAKQQSKQSARKPEDEAEGDTGIGSLDTTMPDDTKQKPK